MRTDAGETIMRHPIFTYWKLAFVILSTLFVTALLLTPDPYRLLFWIPTQTGKTALEGISDKVCHVTVYTFLTFLLFWYRGQTQWRVMATLVGLATAHACATEFFQRFVPERTSDILDLFANLFGIALGACAGVAVLRFSRRTVAEGPETPVPVSPSQVAQLPDWRQASSDAPIGMSARCDFDDVEPIRPKVLNFRFLGILCGTTLAFLWVVSTVHDVQTRRNAKALFDLGREAQKAGNLDAAADYLGRYLGFAPKDVNALAEYGQILDQRVSGPRALRRIYMVYEDVLRQTPTRDDIRRRQVDVAMQLGRTADALDHLSVLRQTFPEDGNLAFKAAQCQEELADFNAAAESYEEAIERTPGQIHAYERLARLHREQLDRPQKADQIIDELVIRNSGVAHAWLVRAVYRQDYGLIEEAVSDMNQALKLAPRDTEILLADARLSFARASAAQMRGQAGRVQQITDQSRSRLRAAIDRTPDNAKLPLHLAQLESHFGDANEAVRWFERALELDPTDTRALAGLADLTIESGQFDQASQSIDRLPRRAHVDALRQYLEARMDMAKQEWTKAVGGLDAARRHAAESPSLLERIDLALAQCSQQLGDRDGATAAYRRALKTDPRSVPARIGLATELLESGHLPEAIAELRPLKDLPQARLLLARLLIIQNLRIPDLTRDWDQVEELLDAAEKNEDDPRAVALLRAALLVSRDRPDAARRVIEEARATQVDSIEFWIVLSRLAELGGDSAQAALWLGQAHSAAGNAAEAERLLKQALEAAPEKPSGYVAVLKHLTRTGRDKEASELLTVARQKLQFDAHPAVAAQCYAAMNHVDQAVREYQKALAKAPRDLQLVHELAETLLQHQRFAEAEPLLEQLVSGRDDQSPIDQSWACRSLAVVLASKGEYPDFLRAKRLLDRNSARGNVTSADQRARAAVLAARPTRENRAEAIRILQDLSDRGQMRLADSWLLGRLYLADGQKKQARQCFESVLGAKGYPPSYVAEYVEFLIGQKEFEEATVWLNRLRELDFGRLPTASLHIRLLAAQGHWEQALEVLKRNTQQNSADSQPSADTIRWAALLADRLSDGSTDAERDDGRSALAAEAERLYRQTARERPSESPLLIDFLRRHGRVDEAFSAMDQVWTELKAETGAALALSLHATGELSSEQKKSIEQRLRKLVQVHPNSATFKACLADLRVVQERYDEGETLYRMALQLDSRNVHVLNNLAWLLAQYQNETNEALTLIESAMKLAGPVPQLLETRACILSAKGDAAAAIHDLETAIAASPTPVAFLHLAHAYVLAGDLTQAEAKLKAAETSGLEVRTLHPLDRVQYQRLRERLEQHTTESDRADESHTS